METRDVCGLVATQQHLVNEPSTTLSWRLVNRRTNVSWTLWTRCSLEHCPTNPWTVVRWIFEKSKVPGFGARARRTASRFTLALHSQLFLVNGRGRGNVWFTGLPQNRRNTACSCSGAARTWTPASNRLVPEGKLMVYWWTEENHCHFTQNSLSLDVCPNIQFVRQLLYHCRSYRKLM